MPAPELFTPDGFSPALAELEYDTITYMMIPDVGRSLALEGLVHKIARDTEPRQLLEAVDTAFAYRDQRWGDCGVEKSTHFAHLLASTNEANPLQPTPDDITVWLHDYSKGAHMGTGTGGTTVEDDHTHRGSVSSILLRKGFIFTERRLPDFDTTKRRPLAQASDKKDAEWWMDLYEYLEPRDAIYTEGEALHVDPDEIHSLKAVAQGTLSLVVRPTFRSFSTVYKQGPTGEIQPIIIEDMPTRRQAAGRKIAQLLERSA